MPFPLFQLPWVPLLQVMMMMDYVELLEFSFCSRKAKELVKMAWRNSGKLRVTIDHEFSVFKNYRAVLLVRVSKDETLYPGSVDVGPMMIGGELLEAQCKSGCLRVIDKSENNQKTLLLIMDLFVDLLPCTFRFALINNRTIWDKFVSSRRMHTCDLLSLCMKLTDEELTFVFDAVDCEELTIDCGAKETFSYEKPIRVSKCLRIFHASWVTWNNLLSLNCEDVEIYDSNIVNADLNEFVKSWLNGAAEKSGRVVVKSIHKLDQAQILSGIDTIPGAKKRPSASKHFVNRFRYENGRDIRRKDGVLATILVDWDKFFLMTVWDDPSPNMRFDHLRLEFV